MMIAFALFAVMVGGIAIPVARRITRPLKLMSDSVERMAGGDLSVRLPDAHTDDEVGRLAQSMNRMVDSFGGMIADILASANRVVSTVDVMTAKVDMTARGAQEQSTPASAIATAAEEMSQTINEIARSAQTASSTSSEAMQTAEEGRHVADESVTTMSAVHEATTQLADMMEKLNAKVAEIGNIVTVMTTTLQTRQTCSPSTRQ